MELTYEAYGAGGVGIVIEVLSDGVTARRRTRRRQNQPRRQGGRGRVGALQLERKGVISLDCSEDKESVRGGQTAEMTSFRGRTAARGSR